MEVTLPSHVFPPTRNPPSMWDRIRVHSSDVGLCVLAFLTSLQVLSTPVLTAYAPSISLKAIDPFLGLLLATFLLFGSAMSLAGILWSGDKVSTGWLLEQMGQLLVGVGWVGYGVLVAYSFPYSTISYGIAFTLGLLAVFRAYVVFCIERAVRPGAEVARTLRGGEE